MQVIVRRDSEYQRMLGEVYSKLNYMRRMVGSVEDMDLKKLMVLEIINDIVSGDMALFLTFNDLQMMHGWIECINGASCMFPYFKYKGRYVTETTLPLEDSVRITEFRDIRVSEDDILRVKS